MTKCNNKVKRNILKYALITIAMAGCLTPLNNPANAAEYNIYDYNNPASPESSFIDHRPLYNSGDILRIEKDMNVDQNIDKVFKASGTYIMTGNGNSSFVGNDYSGFTVSKSIDLIISDFQSNAKDVAFSGFKTKDGKNGSVFNNAGNLIINQSDFYNNASDGHGGVIYNTGNVTISSSNFANNTAKKNGGVIRSDSGILNIYDSKFDNNSTLTANGGAISAVNTTVNITGSKFTNNSALKGSGGAIGNMLYMVIRDSTFSDNYGKISAGAIYNEKQLFISNSSFLNNRTDGNGGAIMSETGNILINSSTFDGNTALKGGAIYTADNMNLTILDSVFTNNKANGTGSNVGKGLGGAIVNNGVLTVINSVFTGNISDKGGAISFSGTELNIAAIGKDITSTSIHGNIGANAGNTVFNGNFVSASKEAINIYKGSSGIAPIINLNAGNGGTIIFDDHLKLGTNAQSNDIITININKEIKYNDLGGSKQSYQAPTDGEIILNGVIDASKIKEAVINLYDGKLSLKTFGDIENFSMNTYGGYLNLVNDITGGLKFNNLTIKGDTGLGLSTDLKAGRIDQLTINNNFLNDGGTLNIKGVHLLSNSNNVGNKTILFSNAKTATDTGYSSIASINYDHAYTSYHNGAGRDDLYEMSTNANASGSYLNFNKVNNGSGLAYVVPQQGSISYSATGKGILTGWDNGNTLNGSLAIYGKDYTIDGKGNAGISVDSKNNSQILEMYDIDKFSNFTTAFVDKGQDYGGALSVSGSAGQVKVIIDNVNFETNSVEGNTKAYGGAIALNGSARNTFANIKNSSFNGNSATSRDAYGGAVAISLGQAIIENTTFENNTAFSTIQSARGGAIQVVNNESRFYGNNLTFKNNIADAVTQSTTGYTRALGGAINAELSIQSVITNSLFEGNIALGQSSSIQGGAIYAAVTNLGSNKGQFTIINSVFKGNHASSTSTAQGGAIYNSGLLDIISDNGNTLFDGNYVEVLNKDGSTKSITSEAIYNTAGINLNAGQLNNITFNDKINGLNGTLNINNKLSYIDANGKTINAPNEGNIIFNNSIINHTLNLYNGKLSVGSDPSKLLAGDEYFKNVSLNAYGGTFSTQNKQIDNLKLNSLALNGNLTFDLDVDLAARTADTLTVSAPITGSGTLILDNIKILTDMKSGVNSVETKFINQSIANAILTDTGKSIATNDFIYDVSLVNNNTTLKFDKANASLGLPEAVANSQIAVFSATRNELVGEWLDPTYNVLQGDLTIQGNKFTIMAQDKLEGIKIENGKTLKIVEVGSVTDGIIDNSWKSFDTALTNDGGTIDITHSIFTNNVSKNTVYAQGNGAVIDNKNGTVTINGGHYKGNSAEGLGGAIYNESNLILTSSAGNDLTFDNNFAMINEVTNKFSNDIYQTASGSTVIEGEKGKITINSGFAGEGSINKVGNNELVLGKDSDSSAFKGSFISEEGTLTVQDGAIFFGGNSEITGGVINWETKDKIPENALLSINNGTLNVRNEGYLNLDGTTTINNRTSVINIEEGSSVENSGNFVVSGNIGGYNDGTETTYGDFINSGTLSIAGDNSGFKGTFIQTGGVATVQSDSKVFSNGDLRGGTIIFTGNSTLTATTTFTSANSDNEKTIEIHSNTNSSSLLDTITKGTNKNLHIVISNNDSNNLTTTLKDITLDERISALTIRDNVTYVGNIKVGSNAMLEFDAENFDIDFNNNITDLNGTSVLSIKTAADREITLDGNSQITGDAFINKSGDGTLVVEGDGRGFTGTFNQDGGKTNVSENGYIFAGIKNINSGELNITSNKGIYYDNVNLADNTQLSHTSTNLTGGDIDRSVLSFIGTGASATFNGIQSVDAEGNPIKTEFDLKESISNATAGTSNTINFNNATVVISGDNYKDNTIYHFENSRIDLVSGNETDLRNVEFDKLTTDGKTKLDFDVDFNRDANGNTILNSDFISASGNTNDEKLLVGDVRIRNDHDNGALSNYESTVLGDGLTFGSGISIAEVSTTAYEYSISADGKKILLDSNKAADDNSLNAMNILTGTRYFMFSKDTTDKEYYYNNKSLEATDEGTFTVLGYNSDASHSVISGFLTNGTGGPTIDKGYLFNIEKATELTIQDLTMEDTYKNGSGSVISIGTAGAANTDGKAHLQNVIIERAESTGDGGAIYNNGGAIDISFSIIKSSSSTSGNGGAISNESGNLSIFNSIIGGAESDKNTAINGGAISTGIGSTTTINQSQVSYNTASQNGGAIVNNGTLTIVDSTEINNNTANNLGGAIYNDGELKISSSTGNDVYFHDNKDSSGANDIYQTDGAKTIFDGIGGKVIIDSGVAGKGSIIKEGISELVLTENSKNTGFTGDFEQTGGFLSVYGSFFGGNSTISGGTLNWYSTEAKSKDAVITVDKGELNVNAVYYLNNINDIVKSDAKVSINQGNAIIIEDGSLTMDRNGNADDYANYDKWDGGIILRDGTFNYDLDSNNFFVGEKGTLNVNGGNLTLSKVDFQGNEYTSAIYDDVLVNLGNTLTPNTEATITLNAENAYLNINDNDNWNDNGTVHLVDGQFIYNSKKTNGKLIAEGGELGVIDSILTLNHSTDLIAKNVQTYIDKNSVLEIKAGKVTLDSNDILAGKITMLGSTGTLTVDNFQNNKNNAQGTYQQDSGTLLLQNNSHFGLSNPNSFINGGDVIVNDSSFTITQNPVGFSANNLTLKNSVFTSMKNFDVNNNLNITNSIVNTINGVIDNNNVENLVVGSNSTAGFGIDIDTKNHNSDKYLINNISTDAYDGGVISVTDFNFVGSTPIEKEIFFKVFDAQTIGNKIVFAATDREQMTPIGRYKLFSLGGGDYKASMIGYNHAVFRSQASTMAVYQNQLVVNNILLDHIMLVSQDVLAQENPNKYAATLPQFAPYQYSRDNGGLWFKSYVNFETLGMTQGLNVGNTAYGTLVGADLPLVKLENGWKMIPTAYIGYNGGHQSLNGAGMYQNGGQGGFMGTFMKKDFIGSVLAYAGGYGNEYNAGGASDTTGNWFAGTAAKAAYNFHPTQNLIVQPTALVSYNIFGKQNYYSGFGALNMNSGLLNGINVAPGLNVIYGRDTWSIYGTVQYMYNINEQVSGSAGNVDLPALSMRHGYIEYGIGATKKWKERLNSYFQVTLRNGGRTGIGFQLGLEYAFDFFGFKGFGKHKKSALPAAPTAKKVIKTLNK